MVNFELRKATPGELGIILDMFRDAIQNMRKIGIDHWDEIYPDKEIIKSDIETGKMFIGYIDNFLVSAIVLNEQQEIGYENHYRREFLSSFS